MSARRGSVAPPWWFIVLVVIAVLPVGSTPAMISACQQGDTMNRTFVWLYPLVMVASAYYSIVSYRTRTLLAWIMLIFMVLISASMFYLFLAQG